MEKNYTTYQPIDFAQDDHFIQWVKTDNAKAARFWEQWLSENPEKAGDVKEARQLIQSIKVTEADPDPKKVKSLWSRIEDSIELEEKIIPIAKKPRLRAITWIGYAAAACAAVLLIVMLNRPAPVVSTAYGEWLTHELPDGSQVQLNAGSRIWYDKESWGEERKIRLNGEAFFQVEKGSPFIVNTNQGAVEVLGTSFNVFSRGKELEVDCFTGKVKVSTTSNRTDQILTKGQGTKLADPRSLETAYVIDTLKRAGWRNGLFVFQDVRLERVADELERQFDVKVKVEKSTLNREFDVNFTRTNLDSALYRISYITGLKYTRNGKTITISEISE